MQFRKKQLALAVSVALASISAAHAADAPQLDAIEVVGHYDNAVGTSDAASQGTVNASLIQNRPAMRTGEMLEFVPGMIVTQHSGDGKANQYFLRGFNLDHGTDFATFVDGIPVNMRTHAHGQGYTDLNFIMPELVERIDYKKGPYFADEGDFASAGAAHFRLADMLPQGIASRDQFRFDRSLRCD
jgi:outer membrane cobalamin receptor